MAKKRTKESKEFTVVCGKKLSKLGLKSEGSDDNKKADRKFEKKLQFYSKVRESIASLSVKKVIEKKNKNAKRRARKQKKLKAYDLSSLSDVLPELNEQQAIPPKREINCKSRQKLVLRETEHLSTVLNHPAFKSDPFASIHQHLLSTQPPSSENKPMKKSTDNDKRKKKKKRSKTSTGPRSMEI